MGREPNAVIRLASGVWLICGLLLGSVAAHGAEPAPDFTITDVAITPDPVVAGTTFAVVLTVKNVGTKASPGGTLSVWVDQAEDAAPGSKGNESTTVSPLSPGCARTYRFAKLAAPKEVGEFTFQACVDAAGEVPELDEGNNRKWLKYAVDAPDFAITRVELVPDPPQAGKRFAAYVTVQNQGKVTGAGGDVVAWADQPKEQRPGSTLRGGKSLKVGTLPHGVRKRLKFTGLKAAAGERTFRALVDSRAQTSETDEKNNQATQPYTCE